MKKIILALAIGVVSTAVLANKPLSVQYGSPVPMGEQQTQNTGAKNTSLALNNISLNAGYVGGMIDKEDVKLRLKGFEFGGTYLLNDKVGIYTKYEQQKDELKLKEFSAGAVYNFYERNNVYINGSVGLGYSWVDGKDDGDKVELEYLTIPVGLEVGYKFTPNIAVYGGVGYKWMYNQDSEACLDGECYDAGSLGELDVNGTTYRTGLRYNF